MHKERQILGGGQISLTENGCYLVDDLRPCQISFPMIQRVLIFFNQALQRFGFHVCPFVPFTKQKQHMCVSADKTWPCSHVLCLLTKRFKTTVDEHGILLSLGWCCSFCSSSCFCTLLACTFGYLGLSCQRDDITYCHRITEVLAYFSCGRRGQIFLFDLLL